MSYVSERNNLYYLFLYLELHLTVFWCLDGWIPNCHSFQVQVRQKAENKKTFYYLEQLILKHKAHEHTLGIKPIHGK